jgi:aminopeptidase N
MGVRDIHSFSEPERVRVTHCSLSLDVLFKRRVLRGSATLQLKHIDPNAPLLLDTRDLQIESVESRGSGMRYRLGSRDPILGSPLEIDLPPEADSVLIRYSTSEHASGLQWLAAEQTAGKTLPFVFSQNQSIHARSWIPIQDSPGIRVTYDARIKPDLDLRVVMSAESEGVENGIHRFRMKLPVPAYLIAIAAGEIGFRPAGPRTGIYAEPSLLDAAAHEFSDLEQLVATVERLYGPYRWGRYDVLVLPPSFPFGGMENPVVTFATPTIIAGDKSLISLVSHELAHSWSGNLVTNATWSDFWLNEGFTTYIENRIQEEVYGREQALMEQVLDRRELEKELAEFEPRDQVLHIDLSGRDPDDGTTQIPYVKGALLLRRMEEVFGRAVFDNFLKSYFEHFSFRSIATEEALAFIRRELLNRYPEQGKTVPIEEWVFAPGLPAAAPRAVSAGLQHVEDAARAWMAGAPEASAIPGQTWNTQQWLEFLRVLERPLPLGKLSELDAAWSLTATGNYEILDEWLQMAIESEYEPAYARLDLFLNTVGRMKFLKPLYKELMKTEKGRTFAREIYARARSGYHPIAQTAIGKIVDAPG